MLHIPFRIFFSPGLFEMKNLTENLFWQNFNVSVNFQVTSVCDFLFLF